MNMLDNATPAAYLAPVSRDRPQYAAVGSHLVLGWDQTLLALDASTGHQQWRTARLVPSSRYITAIHAVGGFVGVSAQPLHGTGPGVEYLLDPSTGTERGHVPALRYEGAVWADASSFVAITPDALVRIRLSTGQAIWSIHIPKSARPDDRTFGSAYVGAGRIVVAGLRLGHNVFDLTDGSPVLTGVVPSGSPSAVEDQWLITSSPAGIWDLRTGRRVWTGQNSLSFSRLDREAGVAYFGQASGNDLLTAVDVRTGKSWTSGLLGGPDLDSVHGGVGVVEVDSWSRGSPETTYFVGRDARTGRPVWSTYALTNFFPAPGLYWEDRARSIGGYTCDRAEPLTGSSPSQSRCADLHFTVVNL